MGVLGCILLSPKECIGECIEKIQSGSEVFYDLRHQTIFDTCAAMYEQQIPVDLISLQSWLKDNQELEQVGGISYLAQLQDSVPSAANLSYYLEIVQEKFLLRKMIHTCTDVVGRVYDYEGDVAVLIDGVERDIFKICDSRLRTTDIKSSKELVQGSLNQIEQLWNNRGSISGLSTGLSDLDKLTDGLHPGDMIVVSGWEKAGKTSLSMGIVEHVILELKLPVAVFSLEMTGESLMTRMLCSNARVNLRNIREGFMAESDFPRLTASAGRLSQANLFVDDSGDLTIGQLRAKARRLVQQYGVKLIAVDYAQLITSPDVRKKDNREQEVSAVSKGVKSMAKELRVPVLLLSQLNDDGRLRESRALGQDADAVWKLKAEDDKENDSDAVPMILRVDRARNSNTGNIKLTFLRGITKFEMAAKHVDNEDVPVDL
jgi:replicative DNA helicase